MLKHGVDFFFSSLYKLFYIFTNFAVSPPIRTKYIPFGKAKMLILCRDEKFFVSTDITFSPKVL
jgi:hypothetical protein